ERYVDIVEVISSSLIVSTIAKRQISACLQEKNRYTDDILLPTVPPLVGGDDKIRLGKLLSFLY
ncbi:MAG: hypothetical protein ACI4QU_00090, partial [Christensenellales bacterium]